MACFPASPVILWTFHTIYTLTSTSDLSAQSRKLKKNREPWKLLCSSRTNFNCSIMNDCDHLDISEPAQGQDALQPTTSTGTTEHEQPPQLKTVNSEGQDLESKYRRVLDKRTKQRDDYKHRYQAAATQLTKYKLSDGGFPQLYDSYLIERVESLRGKIWKFSLEHYEEEKRVTTRGRETRPDHVFVEYTKRNLRSDITPQMALESANWCPMIIETFLWNYFVSRVFNRFRWAGKNGIHMGKVYAIMKRGKRLTALSRDQMRPPLTI